jgi:chromosome segregation ATPase
VTRLSDPEAVLEKIEGVSEAIDALFAAVDRVREIGGRMDALEERARERETELETQSVRVRELESTYAGALDGLEKLSRSSEAELDTLVAEVARKQTLIGEALERFQSENRELDEDRCLIETEMSQFTAFMDGAQEAFSQMREDLERFRESVRVAAETHKTRMETDQRALGQGLAVSLAEAMADGQAALEAAVIDRADRELETVRDALAARLDDLTTLRTHHQRRFARHLDEIDARIDTRLTAAADRGARRVASATEALSAEIRGLGAALRKEVSAQCFDEAVRLESMAEDRMADLTDRFAVEQAEVDAALEILDEERQAAAKDRAAVETALADEVRRVDAGLDRLADALSAADARIGEIEAEASARTDVVVNEARKRVGEAEKQLAAAVAEATASLRQELQAQFVDEARRLTETVGDELAGAVSRIDADRAEVTATIDTLRSEAGMAEALRRETAETLTEMESSLEAGRAENETRLREAIDGERARVDDAIERLEGVKGRLTDRLASLDAAADGIRETLSVRVNDRLADLASFRDRFVRELSARFFDEAQGLQQAAEETGARLSADWTAAKDRLAESVEAARETLTQTADAHAASLADGIDTRLKKAEADRKSETARLEERLEGSLNDRIEAAVEAAEGRLRELMTAETAAAAKKAAAERKSETARLEERLEGSLNDRIEAAVEAAEGRLRELMSAEVAAAAAPSEALSDLTDRVAAGEKQVGDLKAMLAKVVVRVNQLGRVEQARKAAPSPADLDRRLSRIEALLKQKGRAGK